jgi:hypothetical protein
MILFQRYWTKKKCSTSFIGTHQNVLVLFRQLASISEGLCFRFGIVDITTIAPFGTKIVKNDMHPLEQKSKNSGTLWNKNSKEWKAPFGTKIERIAGTLWNKNSKGWTAPFGTKIVKNCMHPMEPKIVKNGQAPYGTKI